MRIAWNSFEVQKKHWWCYIIEKVLNLTPQFFDQMGLWISFTLARERFDEIATSLRVASCMPSQGQNHAWL